MIRHIARLFGLPMLARQTTDLRADLADLRAVLGIEGDAPIPHLATQDEVDDWVSEAGERLTARRREFVRQLRHEMLDQTQAPTC